MGTRRGNAHLGREISPDSSASRPPSIIALPRPNGGEVYFAISKPAELFEDIDETPATIIYQAGGWQPNKTYATAIDIAKNGTAVGRNQPGKTAPILLNGKWIEKPPVDLSKPIYKETALEYVDKWKSW